MDIVGAERVTSVHKNAAQTPHTGLIPVKMASFGTQFKKTGKAVLCFGSMPVECDNNHTPKVMSIEHQKRSGRDNENNRGRRKKKKEQC